MRLMVTGLTNGYKCDQLWQVWLMVTSVTNWQVWLMVSSVTNNGDKFDLWLQVWLMVTSLTNGYKCE